MVTTIMAKLEAMILVDSRILLRIHKVSRVSFSLNFSCFVIAMTVVDQLFWQGMFTHSMG